jgi:membrane protease YdiL (CAAX protease family)
MNILEIIKQLGSTITVTDIIICLLGITLLGIWLFKTSLGRKALADSVPRRNNMPAYLPLIPMFILFGGVRAGVSIRKSALPEIPDWQVAFLDNLILFVLGTATIMVIMFLARDTFARRLKGFGLNVKKIHKDFFAAVVNLLSIWPLVTLAIILTMFFVQLILGPEFKMEPHEELKKIVAYPQLPLRILIFVTVVVIAPLTEEMLFRGLFQTMIRSFLGGAWVSIIMSSALFAAVHYEPAHRPALFMLAVCMGYAYEKSGSLFRPIFIHSLFNASSITFALYSA